MLVRSTVDVRVCPTVLNTGRLAMREFRLDCPPPRVRLTIVWRGVPSAECGTLAAHLIGASRGESQVAEFSSQSTDQRSCVSLLQIQNPTFHPTDPSDSTGSIQRHRTRNAVNLGRNRPHRTIPTDCFHLIIPRSWVRSPPALPVWP